MGFALAWKELGGLEGLPAKPHRSWLPWVLDPAHPNDPTAGSWGVWQWHYDAALIDGLIGLEGVPPADGRGPADMRDDLLAFLPLGPIELKDLDGRPYNVMMTGYSEQAPEPHDSVHPNGGMLVQVEFAKVSA